MNHLQLKKRNLEIHLKDNEYNSLENKGRQSPFKAFLINKATKSTLEANIPKGILETNNKKRFAVSKGPITNSYQYNKKVHHPIPDNNTSINCTIFHRMKTNKEIASIKKKSRSFNIEVGNDNVLPKLNNTNLNNQPQRNFPYREFSMMPLIINPSQDKSLILPLTHSTPFARCIASVLLIEL